MQNYIGTKLINAQPMTRGDYNTLQGWTMPEGQDGSDPGYLVEYLDGGAPNHKDYKGYISWSPKDVFEKAYRAIDNGMSFGDAIIAAKQGMKVARAGWNGQGMFAYIVPAAVYSATTEIAKNHFGEIVPYRAYWALKTAQNDVATWAPSGSDSLANDWLIVL